jgi:hypothetical protein
MTDGASISAASPLDGITKVNYDIDSETLDAGDINKAPTDESAVVGFELNELKFNHEWDDKKKFVSLVLTMMQTAGFAMVDDRKKDFKTLYALFTKQPAPKHKIRWNAQKKSSDNYTWLQLYYLFFHLGEHDIIKVKKRSDFYKAIRGKRRPIREDENPVSEIVDVLTSFFYCADTEPPYNTKAIYTAIIDKRDVRTKNGPDGKKIIMPTFSLPKGDAVLKAKLEICLNAILDFRSSKLFSSQ